MRIEHLDWENRLIFVPDSKTAEGRRLVPMNHLVFDLLRERHDAGRLGVSVQALGIRASDLKRPLVLSGPGHKDVKTAMQYRIQSWRSYVWLWTTLHYSEQGLQTSRDLCSRAKAWLMLPGRVATNYKQIATRIRWCVFIVGGPKL